MGNSAPSLRQLLLPITVAVLWLLPALAGQMFLSWERVSILSPLTTLVFPDTLPERMNGTLEGWSFAAVAVLSALAVAAFATFLLPAPGSESRASRKTTFLAAWACMVLASVAGSAVLSMGLVLAEWPLPRKADLFDFLTPSLLTGAYWGVVWGWLPALLAVHLPAAKPRQAGAAVAAAAAAGGAANDAGPPPPSRRRAAAPRRTWIPPLAAFGVFSSALLLLLPAVAVDPYARAAEPIPEPTQSPVVVYGADPVGPSYSAPDPQWCTGGEVLAAVDGWDAATGHRAARITVQNTGTRTCIVQGHPDLAFEDTEGWVMGITAVHGGSFMTDDTSEGPVTLGPGEAASAAIGWNGTAGAGVARVGTLLVAPFSGTERQELEANIDLAEPGFLTVTGWVPADAGATAAAAR